MEFHINQDYYKQLLEIFAFRDIPQGREFMYPSVDGAMMLNIVTDNNGKPNEIKPLISLPLRLGIDFIQAIANHAKNEGISVKEQQYGQSNMAGKIEVMQDHNKFLQSNLQKLIDFAITPPTEITQSIKPFNPTL